MSCDYIIFYFSNILLVKLFFPFRHFWPYYLSKPIHVLVILIKNSFIHYNFFTYLFCFACFAFKLIIDKVSMYYVLLIIIIKSPSSIDFTLVKMTFICYILWIFLFIPDKLSMTLIITIVKRSKIDIKMLFIWRILKRYG